MKPVKIGNLAYIQNDDERKQFRKGLLTLFPFKIRFLDVVNDPALVDDYILQMEGRVLSRDQWYLEQGILLSFPMAIGAEQESFTMTEEFIRSELAKATNT